MQSLLSSISSSGRKAAAKVIAATDLTKVKSYEHYWRTITPKNHQEYYERWLFAYMSVRTRWQENVKLFNLVKALPHDTLYSHLGAVLTSAGAGMIKTRLTGIHRFMYDFWHNPDDWYPQLGETTAACRDRLVTQIYGLGITKVSFVLEMAFPETCEVVCVDTHIQKLYGLNNGLNDNEYRAVEKHWVKHCKANGLPSAITRHIYWDKLHNEPSTKYWSYVFEQSKRKVA